MNKSEEAINSMWEEVEGRKPDPPKFPTDEKEWAELLKDCYGTNTLAQTHWGLIDFSPDEVKKITGGEKLSYDEYLEIMHQTGNGTRPFFEQCYYSSCLSDFKGEIDKITKDKICFKRIFVGGIYCDGIGFSGKEDHVWMDIKGFEEYTVGDCISFSADVYRYLKTSNGKSIDFGLRSPHSIRKIDSYDLPTDDDLLMQSIDQLVCEVCLFNEHCYMGLCIADEQWRNDMRQSLYDFAKAIQNK